MNLESIFTDEVGGILTYEANSSNTNVAMVNICENYLVITPVQAGKTTIKVKALNECGRMKEAEFNITIEPQTPHN
ncbi:hypothetical protein [Paenibacillus pini]|uniref:Uncharacterized protein n=1 Tax=Paenibacillus pini JCM 16418 TaxID=1236976 RepID=W7YG21_9BACL|nr:hypothetical protein [Paenibacillus pini]GAF07417.1 hypothetical protein JCM16418_1433 [Paenibacillus pini JCM 16418]